MSEAAPGGIREGLLYGLGAYGLWGLVPLYFGALATVPAIEILCHRIVWSLFFVLALVLFWGRGPALWASLTTRPVLLRLALSAALVCCNWFVYIYGATSKQVLQTSLGYFINPLFSVLLGLLFFRERLRPLQWTAVGMAALGVVYLLAAGQLPWIAMTLAISFGFYALVRKKVPVDGLIGLTIESIVLFPAAAVALVWWGHQGTLVFCHRDRATDALLVLAGVITALPLLCFGQAARRLPLSTLGFLQYLSPSLQFVVAMTMLGETPTFEMLVAFAATWAGLVVFSVDSVARARLRPLEGAQASS